MSVEISGAVALVTGANRGIGRALVEALLAKGADKVYAGARDPAKLAGLVQQYGPRLVALELDITDPKQISAAAAAAPDVDLLINNAGVAGEAGVAATEGQNLVVGRREFEVNVFGTLALRRFQKNKHSASSRRGFHVDKPLG